jgi:serine/threonine-protein kinase HipA
LSYEPVDLVYVSAWGQAVGAVALDPASGYYAFEYEDAWIRSGQELAPIWMPARRGPYVFPSLNAATYWRLPALLADALPDDFGNALVDRWLGENGVPKSAITPLDRLAYAADRGMGALEFAPPVGRSAESTAIELSDLVTAARAAIVGDLDRASAKALHELIQVGTSAGGARAKAVIAYNPGTNEVRSGQLTAPPGFSQWLIKFDGVGEASTRELDPLVEGAGYGRVEFAYHRMASIAGVEMAESRLLEEGGRAHFLTRRFDRDDDGGRLHVQTLCALDHLDFKLPKAHSYSQYLAVVDRLGLDRDRLEQAFRRIVFNVAAVNHDDHTKNLAFLLRDGGDWDLSPAYDVTHAHNPSGEWTMDHQMSVNDKFSGITLDDLRQVGDRWKVPGIKDVLRDVLAAVERWPEFAEEAGVDAEHRDRIAADLAEYRPR